MRKKLLYMSLTAIMMVVSMSAYALDKVNGVYQIGTAADLEEFAVLVNGGEVFANAVLTTDIDRGVDGTMIGTDKQMYQGTFDGKGHTIKVDMYPEVANAALFQYTGFGAVIQNLKVQGTITTASKFAAGLVARNYGIIRGCYVDVTINSSVPGDATHGGIVAVGMGGCTVENCLAKIAINGETTTNCGGVVGWAEKRTNIVNCLVLSDDCTFAYSDASNGHSSNISRNEGCLGTINVETYNEDPYANRPNGACYNNYVTNQWSDNVATTVVPYDELADGRICYQLNNDQSRIAWVQRIGTDPFPVPAAFGTGRVYASASTGCNGQTDAALVLTFSNEGSDQAAKHQFDKYGVCTECGCFDFHMFEFEDPEKFDQTDRSVLLKSKEDIDKVEGWNRIAQGFRLNMKMVNDIEYIAEEGHYIFNPSDWIDGNFNGDGHTMTIEMTEMGEKAALFPEMAGKVENLILHGNIQTNAARSGSISGNARMTLVRNVYSDVNITSTVVGDNTAGGLFGWMGEKEKHVENCIYAGTFTLPGSEGGAHCARVGGIAGWTATKTYITNCAVLGEIIGAGNQTFDDDTENSQNIARNPGNIVAENVYVLNPIEGNAVSDHDKYTHYENEEGVGNGELAFFLNSKQSGLDRFYQVIGTDPQPMPIKKAGGLIYSAASSFRCDGTPLESAGYTNDSSGEPTIPPHTYQDGWCIVCGHMQEDYLNVVDGFYEIHDGAEFVWWCQYANLHSNANARLMDDIDMSDYNDRFVPVGLFVGEFDGQGHTFSSIDISGGDYFGLISLIGDGARIHDFSLDKSCSISGNAFVGIIGGTSGSGNIYIDRVGNEGNVTGNAQNICGILGVDVGGSMTLHISNCWFTGTILAGRESAAICGYSGSDSEVYDCWGVFTINESGIYDCDSFTRGAAKVTNCYEADIEDVDQSKQQHYRAMAENRKVNPITLEEVANGALCYKLNKKQFRNPTWYQTLEEDEHPYPFDNHGVVIYAAGKYYSMLTEADIAVVAAAIQSEAENAFVDVIATQALIDEFKETVEAIGNVTTVTELADALDAISAAEDAVNKNAAVYQTYIDKCTDVKAYLDENKTFAGELRDGLEAYLNENDEPTEENPLGTYLYIIEEHTATADEIKAETDRVTKWLQDAIESGYIPGTDISGLIPNSDFSKEAEGWTNAWSSAYAQVKDDNGKPFYGVEGWNRTGDMYQTVEGMKPGYYLVGINGCFRPSNNRYSTNYAAGIYANEVFNYFPAAIEGMVPVDEAVDGENCNLTIASAYDLPIYEDGFSTSGEDGLIGYVVQGPTGMAIAAKVNRYEAYTIANVGEDGKLTIGMKNPGTTYSNDWTGWGALKVVYCGDDETECNNAFDIVLENMTARAQTILDYIPDDEIAAAGPNFPAAMKAELEALVAQVDGAGTVAAKAELVAKFSDLFQRIYEGKQAYIQLAKAASMVDNISAGDLPLVEKDPESGEWVETGDMFFTDDEINALFDASQELGAAYNEGLYSVEEALDPEAMKNPIISNIVPKQDEEGYLLISTVKQFVAYRAIASDVDKYAKGKLLADIDLKGIAMQPIGHNRGENAQHIFAGVFDGQGHTLANVFIDDKNIPSGEYAEPATMFYELQNATVKNFRLTGEFYTSHQFSGPITRWMSGSSTIENCEIEVAMHFASNLAGDTSSGGLIGRNGSANSLINNCLVKTHLIGDGDSPFSYAGGVAGWADASLVIKNTLILNEYTNVGVDGDNSRTISRGTKCTPTNVYVSQYFREQEGTLASAEQLASGEICWALNGNTADNAHWFQKLGTDATPHLLKGSTVWKYGDEFVNTRPNIQLNAFASNLNTATNANQVVVAYTLNADAKSAAINFYAGGELKYSHVLKGSDLMAGGHEIAIDNSLLGVAAGTDMTYELDVTALGVNVPTKIGDSYKVWGPYGMTINNNTASKGFGQLLMVESYPEEIKNTYISYAKPGALYAFDVNFQPINSADGTPGFYGGLEIKGETPLAIAGTYQLDLRDIRFSADGRLFVARASGTSNSSVYELNPEDLDEPWKPIFKGGTLDEATGVTYVGDQEQNRMALGLAFEGKGEDLKMYVLGGKRSNGGNNTSDYNCSIYNLGTATEWTTAPSANYEPLDGKYTYSPVDVGIHEDLQGGLWYLQNRNTTENPPLKHFNAAEGKEDYNGSATSSGKMTITPDGKYLAIPQGSGKIVLYETNYVPMANGKIFMNPVRTINVSESRITGLAFDYAGNLYVASASTETLSRYAIPSWTDNKTVTPAPAGFKVGSESGDPDAINGVNVNTANGAIYNIAGQRVSKAQKGIFIQDGRKVANK
ncbi:MAG: hypothetical protein IJR69_05605 [Bacteroidaceae bacterium]|nr:hypothetical protein [Bacteroidaceae bacterium]